MEKSETERQPKITIDTLKCRLADAGVNFSVWGDGNVSAKSIDNLLIEINNGEAELLVDKHGELLRQVNVIGVYVYYVSSEYGFLKLRETEQIFANGKRRTRDYLPHSMFEKMKPSETPEAAAIRGLREELGINVSLELFDYESSERIGESHSYPGLNTLYISHDFSVLLDDDQFKLDGYIEVQNDKTTHFGWERLHDYNL